MSIPTDTPFVKGPPNKDIDQFLSKVTNVEEQLKGLVDGTLKPEDVHIPGEGRVKSAEQIAREKEEEEKARVIRKRLEAERRERDKIAERKSWWEKASLTYAVEPDGSVIEVTDEVDLPPAKTEVKGPVAYKRGLDYDRWEGWTPTEDPASKEEEAKKEAELNEIKDAEFEKLNPDFCDSVKDDIKEREKKSENKAAASLRLKTRANGLFKKGEVMRAITVYHDALLLTPYEIPLLTNLAMAHLTLGELDEAEDFCKRALTVHPRCVKALYRRAMVHEKRTPPDLVAAVADVRRATELEPKNEDLAKELARLEGDLREREFEASVLAKAKAAGAVEGVKAAEASGASARVGASGSGAAASATATATASPPASVAAAPPTPPVADDDAAGGATGDAAGVPTVASNPKFDAGAEPTSTFLRVDRLLKTLRFIADDPDTNSSADVVAVLRQDLGSLGAVVDKAENSTYVRSSGVLHLLCTSLARGHSAGIRDASCADAFASGAVQERACLLVGAACHGSVHNERQLRNAGGLDALVEIACDERTEEAFVAAAVAARAALELVSVHEKSRAVVASHVPLLKASEASLAKAADALLAGTSEVPDTYVLESASKAATLIQIVALQQKNRTVIEALPDAVPTLLRIVAGCSQHMLLASPLMQSATAALANLAHHAPLRAKFAEKLAGVESVAGVQALLALLVMPVPYSEHITVSRGSALAALSNAGLDEPSVRQALCDCGAVDGLIGTLEGKGTGAAAAAAEAVAGAGMGAGGASDTAAALATAAELVKRTQDGAGDVPPPPVIAERCASLLARLTQQADGLKELSKKKQIRRVAAVLQGAAVFGESQVKTEDALVRVLAAAVNKPSHVATLADTGCLATLAGILRAAVRDIDGRAIALGNLTKIIITVTMDPASTNWAHYVAMLAAGVPELLVEVLKKAGPGVVRKNAAVALARLAKHPECMARIREVRGMEILVQLGRELTV